LPWLYLCSEILSFAVKRNIYRELNRRAFSSGYSLSNMSQEMNNTIREKEIPELKMQDVGGAELPYLYYEGEAPQILFAHATGFLPWLWHPIIEEIVTPNQAWVPYICNYRECDPEKGGLAWGIIAED